MISLCHATHGRPEKMHACRDAWLGMAKMPDSVEHVFAFGTAGWELFEETLISRPDVTAVIGEPSSSVGGWNRAYAASHGSIVVQLSDDMMPAQDWDVAIREAIGDVTKPRVLGCSPDGPAGSQGGLLTLAICTRAYCDSKGYFIYPEYHGVFEDDDFTQSAIMDDVLVDTYDALRFAHTWGGHDGDATYKRQNSAHGWFVGRMVYLARKRSCYPSIARDELAKAHDVAPYGDIMAADGGERDTLRAVRAYRDCYDIRNLAFERGSYRDLFMQREWHAAMDESLRLTEKYRAFNGGNMKLDGLAFVINWCKEHM